MGNTILVSFRSVFALPLQEGEEREPIRKLAESIRRHEDREAETGEVMQCLIDPDQGPEPWMCRLQRHA